MDKYSKRYKIDYDGMGDFSRIPTFNDGNRKEDMSFSHKCLNFFLNLLNNSRTAN
ncbi:hypothetical protein AB2B38_006025 [Balneola sp. MJW-20]|uniref:hypothetical protein n=1 Tax=Gracilimonas aurantiaca TaxID=3234185 RepID=UPI0034671AD9